jgi:proton-dependent oligopeptide transporter, POT family
MRALLVLYLVEYVLQPGTAGQVIGLAALKRILEAPLGPLDIQPFASNICGIYTGLVYLTPIFGGIIADRVLGHRRTVCGRLGDAIARARPSLLPARPKLPAR